MIIENCCIANMCDVNAKNIHLYYTFIQCFYLSAIYYLYY